MEELYDLFTYWLPNDNKTCWLGVKKSPFRLKKSTSLTDQ